MRFVSGNYNGKQQMFIQTDNDDAKLNDVTGNATSFKFHTDFSYFQYLGEWSGTVVFPTRNVVTYTAYSKKSSSTFAVPWWHKGYQYQSVNFSAGSESFNSVLINGVPITTHTLVQTNGDAKRFVTAYLAGSTLFITENSYTYTTSLPAISVSFFTSAFVVADTAGSDPGVLFRAEPGRVTFGQGKFDTDGQFLYENTTNYVLPLTTDKTIGIDSYAFSTPSGYAGERLAYHYLFNGQTYKYGTIANIATPSVKKFNHQ